MRGWLCCCKLSGQGSNTRVAVYELRFLCRGRWCCSLGDVQVGGFYGINSSACTNLSVEVALESSQAMRCVVTLPCCTQQECLQRLSGSCLYGAWSCSTTSPGMASWVQVCSGAGQSTVLLVMVINPLIGSHSVWFLLFPVLGLILLGAQPCPWLVLTQ